LSLGLETGFLPQFGWIVKVLVRNPVSESWVWG